MAPLPKYELRFQIPRAVIPSYTLEVVFVEEALYQRPIHLLAHSPALPVN